MDYWKSAVDKVTTWTFLNFRFLDTRNLNQDALESTFCAISLHCGSENNQLFALETVIIKVLTEVCMALRGWLCLSWTSYTHISAIQCFFNKSFVMPLQVITERPLSVF